MSAACPCCGKPMEAAHAPLQGLMAAPVPGANGRILLEVLGKAYPRAVAVDFLEDRLFADDPDGGPENARKALWTAVERLRPRIEKYGWTIPKWTRGFYRLEPMGRT